MKKEFLRALTTEIQIRSDKKIRFDTIYFGGGTPSLIEPCDIEKIIIEIHENFHIDPNSEITIEVNPGTIDKNFFSDIKKFGINRINIGVQSFQDRKLKFLKRIHSAKEAEKSIELAIKSNFDNIGLDLIYGLPEEDRKNWIADIEAALNFNPDHISCYMLSYERGTKMYNDLKKGLIIPLTEDISACLFTETSHYLTEIYNYFHYEISNFASSIQKKSIHNQKYWSDVPYIGLGPSAHSFDKTTRSWNFKDVTKYITALRNRTLPISEKEILSKEQKIMEMIMLRLRTSEGIKFEEFRKLAGKNFTIHFKKLLKQLESNSMGVVEKNKFSLTPKGMLFLDSIVSLFCKQYC